MAEGEPIPRAPLGCPPCAAINSALVGDDDGVTTTSCTSRLPVDVVEGERPGRDRDRASDSNRRAPLRLWLRPPLRLRLDDDDDRVRSSSGDGPNPTAPRGGRERDRAVDAGDASGVTTAAGGATHMRSVKAACGWGWRSSRVTARDDSPDISLSILRRRRYVQSFALVPSTAPAGVWTCR